AAARLDAAIRSGAEVTDLTSGAVRGIIARAGAVRGIAEPALAIARVGARFAELEQTGCAAAVAVLGVTVVTAFAGFEDAVTTAGVDALIRGRARLAQLTRG